MSKQKGTIHRILREHDLSVCGLTADEMLNLCTLINKANTQQKNAIANYAIDSLY